MRKNSLKEKRDDDVYTVTSVSLPIWQLRWLKENTYNRSELIRDVLENHINYSTGFEGVIKRLEEKKNVLLNELEDVNTQIQTIKSSGLKAAEESNAERKERIAALMREIGG